MAANLGTLTLDLIAKIGGFTGPMDQAARHSQKRAKEIEKSMANAADAIKTVVGALGVGVSFTQIIRATADFQNEQAQLAAVLKSTGEAAGFSQGKLNEMAEALSRTSIISAGEINQAQTTLLAFTGIVGEEFPRALQAAVDMASRTGMSVVSASETIGRALDIPSKGLAALSKQGFRFSEEQKKLAEYLESTGRTAEAQAMILAALEESYGGAAQAARDTLGGALTALSNSFNDLLTGEDGVDQATDAINSLTDTLSDPRIKEAFGVIVAGVFGVTEAVARALPYVVDFTKWAAEELAVIAGGIGLHDLDRLEEKASKLQSLLTTMESRGETGYAIYSSAKADYEKVKAQLDQAYALAEMADNLGSGKGKEAPKLNQQALLKEAEAARESAKAQEDAIKARAKASEAIDRQVAALQLQADTLGMSAQQAALYKLRLEGATEAQIAQAESALLAVDAFKKQESIQDNYKRLLGDLRTDEEKLTDQMRERLAVLDAMQGLDPGQRMMVAGRIAGAATSEAPSYGGLAPEVGGAFGELLKIDEAQEKLQEWYDTQLEMLEQFRAERADLSAVWDAEELALKQQHEDELARIEQARQMAQLASAESLFGDLAGLTKTFAGEQSGLYKAMFAVQKAAAIAQSAVAIQQGIAMAAANPWPVNLAAMASVAAATASIVSNIGAIGMAHDGIDAIPETGTWLLQKGERVTTAETSAKLDRTLEDIQKGGAGKLGNVQIINNGEPMTARTELDGETLKIIMDRVNSEIMGDGSVQRTISKKFGLQNAGW